MAYNPNIHHRRSIRLRGYDYAQGGAYFVTACTCEREMLLEDEQLRQIVERVWYALPLRFPTIALDEVVIMPNHVHFIVWLTAISVGAPLAGAHDARTGVRAGASPAATLAAVVGAFKSIVANEWLEWVNANSRARSARVWQRNYYEHIVRDEDELTRIRQYIRDNPAKWAEDSENPANWGRRSVV